VKRSSHSVRFRRSPYLVTFWRDAEMVIHNYATGARVRSSPIVCDVLNEFTDWRPAAAVVSRRSDAEAPALRELIEELARLTFLERSDRDPSAAVRAMQSWSRWNPEAGFFHFATKDVAYESDVATAERRQRRRARTDPMPASMKSYPSAPQVTLPAPRRDGELPGILTRRRTWRHFSKQPVDVRELATLLQLTWGVQRSIAVAGQGRVAFKTSPSGGARHPIEAYVVARRVRGVEPGLYHYAADRHTLERLRSGAGARHISDYCARQHWFGRAAAIVIMTAIFERERWRYSSPRAYRAVLLDAGHLCQTFCLVATWLQLAPFCTMALDDSRIERDLGLDGVTESVIYVAGVGSQPAGGWNRTLQRKALRT
jgi:SagB-type dehydrogenase family enzyme